MTRYTDMSSGDMLQELADDASKWADAFAEQHPEVERDIMIGWFANAIENTWDVRCSRLAKSEEGWNDFKDQIERVRTFWRELA